MNRMKVLHTDCLWILVTRTKFLRLRGSLRLGTIFFDTDSLGLELRCSICPATFDLGDTTNEKLNANHWVLLDRGMASAIFL